MWITAVTYDLVALRQMSGEDVVNMLSLIQSKKDELKAIDGAGNSTAEYPNPDNYSDVPLDQTTLVVKRAWNHETNAQAFVDHLSGISHVIAVLEGQV